MKKKSSSWPYLGDRKKSGTKITNALTKRKRYRRCRGSYARVIDTLNNGADIFLFFLPKYHLDILWPDIHTEFCFVEFINHICGRLASKWPNIQLILRRACQAQTGRCLHYTSMSRFLYTFAGKLPETTRPRALPSSLATPIASSIALRRAAISRRLDEWRRSEWLFKSVTERRTAIKNS